MSAWTYYYDLGELDACDGTVLFQTNIYNDISDPKTHVYFRACTASGGTIFSDGRTGVKSEKDAAIGLTKRQALSVNSTAPAPTALTLTSWGQDGATDPGEAKAAVDALRSYLQSAFEGTTGSNSNVIFARKRSVVAGMYVGSQVDKTSAASAINSFGAQIEQGRTPARLAAQTCGSSNQTISPQYFGVTFDGTGSTANVQKALRSWSDAECIAGESSEEWQSVSLKFVSGTGISVKPGSAMSENIQARSPLHARATCRYSQGKLQVEL